MKTLTKLNLNKSIVTQLSDDQIKKFVGGIKGGPGLSCNRHTCSSKPGSVSCDKRSCNCAAEVPGDAGQGLEG